MTSPEASVDPSSDGEERRTRESWRRLARIVYRDPEHIAERLTLSGAERVGESAQEWATRVHQEHPDVPRGVIAEEVRIQTARVASIDGAVAGTPFLIALLPGYVAYLWQEGIMLRRIAALYGHDSRDIEASAQALVLRGVHPTVDAARAALLEARDSPLPDRPKVRRSLRIWVRSVHMLLIFGGFVDPPSHETSKEGHWRLKAVVGLVVGVTVFVVTWVLPVSFMIAMAWGCESHARSLGHRTIRLYGGESAQAEVAEDSSYAKRQLVRGSLLGLSIAVPIAFIAYANHVSQDTGISWLGALGALVAVSLVIAATVLARRYSS
jgi:hypothetical protein